MLAVPCSVHLLVLVRPDSLLQRMPLAAFTIILRTEASPQAAEKLGVGMKDDEEVISTDDPLARETCPRDMVQPARFLGFAIKLPSSMFT